MQRVLQILGSLSRAGAETTIMNIYRNIDKTKVQFDFIVREHCNNGYEDEVLKLGGKIFYIESPKKIGIIASIKQHIKVMKENGPYIAVHANLNVMSWISLCAAKYCKIKNRICHSHSTKFGKNKAKVLLGKILNILFSTNRCACGKDAGKAMFGKMEFTIIPNGIDINRFLPIDSASMLKLKDKLDINSEVLNICHVGRFIEVKNHGFILALAKELERRNINFSMYLIGDGELLETTKSNAKKLGINSLKFLGNIPNVNDYFRTCDLFILPSLYEGLPVVGVETQCAGLPSVLSDRITDEIDCKIGLVKFLPLSIDLWADYIVNKEYSRESDTKKIKEKIQQNNFDISNNINLIYNLYSIGGPNE